MWNFLGDHDFKADEQQVNGTYFLTESRLKLSGQIHWNLFDQVMVSQSIVDTLPPSSVKIISEFTNTLTRNRVKMVADSLYHHGSFINSWFSDHLPVLFEIDTTKLI